MNRKHLFVGSGMLIVSLLVPMLSFAHPSQQKTLEEYCVQVLVFEANHNKKFAELDAAYNARKSEQIKVIQDLRAATQQKFIDGRKQNDEAIIALFEKIDGIVTANAEQKAVDSFKKKVINADQLRQQGIDAAFKVYNDALDTVHTKRKNEFEGAKNTFANEARNVLNQTKTDCKNKTKTVVEVFEFTTGSLKAALAKLTDATSKLSPTNASLDDLSKQRDEAITKAQDTFNQTITASIAELKAELGL